LATRGKSVKQKLYKVGRAAVPALSLKQYPFFTVSLLPTDLFKKETNLSLSLSLSRSLSLSVFRVQAIMNSLIKSLFKFWDGIYPKNPYERLGKAKKAKAVRVPKGHVSMYVGKEEKLYEVPVKFLLLQSFQELLEHYSQSVVDDLDIENGGPIVLTCSTDVFDWLLREANAKIA
jgi:hypothetical protein